MGLLNFLLGRPLASSEDENEKLGPAAAIPVFGLDALGSAAYGPEAALTLLMPLGLLGIRYVVPISATIIVLLAIVCLSYLQTIPAYPHGGGSYTVASRNLGRSWGLLAGTALMIDYILTVAVGISAGIGALVSAIPKAQPHTLALCMTTLLVITTINLRGARESGIVFLIPTYLYIACIVGLIAAGVWKALAAGGHPAAEMAPHTVRTAAQGVTAWILLKAFASGCTAMTGVEAVSNGVTAFREPPTRNARITLITIAATLAAMLAGIAYLCRAYQIGATEPGSARYESVLSQLAGAVFGRGALYYTTVGSILLALVLQANTAFAGFPLLCRTIAEDGFLPRGFANRGRRLVYTQGIVVLTVVAGALLAIFGGVTDRLIPLFAVGAFLAFTLSQAGMVVHWRKDAGRHARKSAVVNAVGAAATGATLVVVIVSKFAEGAWITVLLIPAILWLMLSIKRHDLHVQRELLTVKPLSVDNLCAPLVVVPIEDWNRISQRALRFALSISQDVRVVHIKTEDAKADDDLEGNWAKYVEKPARAHNMPPPRLYVVPSPYRFVINPILNFVLDLERLNPERHLAVIVPNLVEKRWHERFLHNQRGELLTALLLLNGNKRISIVNVPWYLNDSGHHF